MIIKTWRFITIMLVALSMAMAFCHLLQLEPRLNFSAEMWRNTQIMYQHFGPPIGAVIEGGAWLSAVLLALLVRRRHPAFGWTLACAICLITAHAVWWLLVLPVNNVMANWTVGTMPSDWTFYRNQWEYTHAARAILQIIGFGALVISTLVETPSEAPHPVAERTHFREVSQT